MADDSQNQGMPQPHPSLKTLEPFIGTWSITGRIVGSDEDNIKGKTTFRMLPGGFFVEQHIKMDFNGYDIDALELIGYNQAKDRLDSLVYTTAPEPLPYHWKVNGDDVEIEVIYGPFDASFHGGFSDNGKSYSGSWRPNPGSDTTINIPYDITGHRID